MTNKNIDPNLPMFLRKLMEATDSASYRGLYNKTGLEIGTSSRIANRRIEYLSTKTLKKLSVRTGIKVSVLSAWYLEENKPIPKKVTLKEAPVVPKKVKNKVVVECQNNFIQKLMTVTMTENRKELSELTGLDYGTINLMWNNKKKHILSSQILARISIKLQIKVFVLSAWLHNEKIEPADMKIFFQDDAKSEKRTFRGNY